MGDRIKSINVILSAAKNLLSVERIKAQSHKIKPFVVVFLCGAITASIIAIVLLSEQGPVILGTWRIIGKGEILIGWTLICLCILRLRKGAFWVTIIVIYFLIGGLGEGLQLSWSPLEHAAYMGDVNQLRSLLEVNNIKMKNIALAAAVSREQIDAAQILLDNGADINSRNRQGNTGLMNAAAFGHLDMVRFLLDKGANLDEKDSSGRTAFMLSKHSMIQGLEKEKLLQEAYQKEPPQRK